MKKLLIPFIFILILIIPGHALAKDTRTSIGYCSGDTDNSFFSKKFNTSIYLKGNQVGNKFILKKIRYRIGPEDSSSDKNNLEINYLGENIYKDSKDNLLRTGRRWQTIKLRNPRVIKINKNKKRINYSFKVDFFDKDGDCSGRMYFK